MDLTTPVKDAGRAFKQYASRLEKLGITKLGDFLYHFPFRYDDYSLISKLGRVQPGETITIQGEVVEIKNEFTKRFKTLQKAKIKDETGTIDITWFNQPFIPKSIHSGDTLSLSGKVDMFLGKPVMQSPQYEVVTKNPDGSFSTLHTGRLVPIYPETHGVSSKWIRRQVYKVLHENKEDLQEYLPESLMHTYTLMNFQNALLQIHFPDSYDTALRARQRLSFDELFFLQLAAIHRRTQWKQQLRSHPFTIEKFQKKITLFWDALPFSLTNAQRNAIHEIFTDLTLEKPMNRLLEGDVGSGKTVVATAAMYIAYLNGFQSVLMAPTEILAQQHFLTVSRLLEPLGVKTELRTGSQKGEKEHTSDILIGTHAVLSKTVTFEKLGLVVIDEQQRFGVEQRAIIKQKGNNPHLLTMTATPIPRTIALTMYGDLDLSVLDEMPKGRKQIKTWLVPSEKREAGYAWIRKEIQENDSQVFIICPFIEESENMMTVKAAKKEYERLQKDVFPDLRLFMLHGKQKAKEKDKTLKDFKEKKADILVATPVVEVGIDIPNATIILIEASERFGLSQLHQLRGRVGRGDKQSYCLLFTESTNPQTKDRLRAMETTHSGAELAELDLRLRGAGDLYGTMQHGRNRLKIANFSDLPLVEKAKNAAKEFFPILEKYPLLFQKLESMTEKQIAQD